MINLEKEVQFIKGVGPNRVKLLNKLGIFTLEDLITYYPREYEDRSKPKNICDLIDGEEALISAIPITRLTELKIRKNLTICKLVVRDETGSCQITWYNQGYLKNSINIHNRYKFYGKVNIKAGKVEMQSPVFDLENVDKNTGKIIPIYPLTYSLSQNTIRKIIEEGIKEIYGKMDETLPDYLIEKYNLYDINTAIKQIHFPNNFECFNKARKRLVFEELLSMQLALISLKKNIDKEKKGISFRKDVYISDIINKLPFSLTKAQLRVLEEIEKDMESEKTMNRLLQGDVGSGKTVIAILSAYKAVKSG